MTFKYSSLVKNLKVNSSFEPNVWSLLFNPYFICRKNLLAAITSLKTEINGKVLDVGCGTKPYKNLFSNANSYVGLEFDSPVLMEKKIEVEHVYDGGKFPFEDESFDSIVCFQVLEHVFENKLFIQELKRVLKHNGKALLTVPFIWGEHEKPYDFGRFTSFGLSYILKSEGFEILTHKKCTSGFLAILQLFISLVHSGKKENFLIKFLARIIILICNFLSLFFKNEDNDIFLDNVILIQKNPS